MGEAADFFVGYTSADRAWAEWIAWQLEAEGYQILVQAWDFRPGEDFVHQMQQAIQRASRTIAVLSPTYPGSTFGEAEWRAAFASDPTGERGLLLPVRVGEVERQGCSRPGFTSTWSVRMLQAPERRCWRPPAERVVSRLVSRRSLVLPDIREAAGRQLPDSLAKWRTKSKI
jgi:TIR domain